MEYSIIEFKDGHKQYILFPKNVEKEVKEVYIKLKDCEDNKIIDILNSLSIINKKNFEMFNKAVILTCKSIFKKYNENPNTFIYDINFNSP